MANLEITKLKRLLSELDVSQTQFSHQVAKQGIKSESWAHQVVRGDIGLDERGVKEIVIPVLKEMTDRDDLTV